ncbi:hypothetical protein BTUL_0162g00230 [Botrytis tulipae]|uniref:C2H2-type domain-containing protein n=1 Tax=Botrytis tulipae TaxID=87230 RepID=A0A4Z1EBH9_9HELO|nr:hypothetical protein BTUL_0162g00230 [Botrytis tulipae]
MSLASTQHPFNNTLPSTSTNDIESKNPPDETEANISTIIGAYTNGQKHTSMERGSTAYTQSGLQTPYPHAFTDAQSEDSPADNTSAAQYPPQHQDVRSNQYSTTATPTSEYGAAYPPSSARSANFDHLHRAHYSSNNTNSSGGMAQPTSPSIPLQDGRSTHQSSQIKSDQDVPIDPSIAASSPTYPPYNPQHATYSAQEQMHHPYPPTHSGGSMYSQPRPNWHGYADPSAPNPNVANHPNHPNVANHPAGMVPTPYTSASPQAQSLPASAGRPSQDARLPQIYSFVPIPGSSQQKRPRRRFEEIERMYKCGHQGCEKAYGTLNHLNAHVTMQSHGNKRTPEEFKEIRKEWKARKKEEEQQRKEQEVARAGGAPAVPEAHPEAGSAAYSRSNVQLPPISNPIGYQPGAQVPNQYQQSQAPASSVQHLQGYGNAQPNMDHYTGYPASPYGSSNHMYSHQSNPAQTKYEH